MKRIWTDPHVGVEGEHVSFEPLDCGPPPTDPAGPPMFVGGAAPGGIRRAAAWADGWMPLAGRGDEAWAERARQLREAATEAGRDAHEVSMTVFGATPSAELVETLARADIERVVFALAPTDTDAALAFLDSTAAVCAAH